MNILTIEHDFTVYCLTATSFPEGVAAVYNQLHTDYPPGYGRSYYGLSWPDGKGSLVYKAAVRLNDTDTTPAPPYEPFIVTKGDYLAVEIKNFMDDVQLIGKTFKEMIADPRIDPKGYCLEAYLNPTDVRCMVKLA